MTRAEALSPLKTGEGRLKCTAGVLIRKIIRRGALAYNVDYYEEKGFLESDFIFRGPEKAVRAFIIWIQQNIEKD